MRREEEGRPQERKRERKETEGEREKDKKGKGYIQAMETISVQHKYICCFPYRSSPPSTVVGEATFRL